MPFIPFPPGTVLPGGQVDPVLSRLPWVPQKIYASLYPPHYEETLETSSAIAYQCFAASLMAIGERYPLSRCVMLASTYPGPCASWIVMNLVYFLCKARQRVVLIDGDAQFPSVHHAFDLQDTPGQWNLLQALEGIQNADLSAADLLARCQRVNTLSNLWILSYPVTSGRVSQVPDGRALEKLFQMLRHQVDWLVVDAGSLYSQDNMLEAFYRATANLVLLEDHTLSAARAKQDEVRQRIRRWGLRLLGRVQRGGDFFYLQSVPSYWE